MNIDGSVRNMKILVVSPDFPFPPNHGGRVDIWARLKIFVQMGYIVDLAVTTKVEPSKDDIDQVKRLVRNLWIVKRKFYPWNLLSGRPFQCASRASLMKIELTDSYDVVWLEGEYVEPILRNPQLKAKRIFLRLHNDEHGYFKQLSMSTSNVVKKFFYLTEAIRIKRVTKRLFELSDKLLYISIDEMSLLARNNQGNKAIFLPAPLSKERFDTPRLGEKVIFVGSLFMPNNRDAIMWFLKEVHPLITFPDYHLMICGNSRGESLGWLYKMTNHYKNVTIYDTPADLEPLYSQSRIFVNPMRFGGGVKLKTLEAIQNGLAVVSTSKGAEGTGLIPGEHYLLADQAEEFARLIEQLLRDRKLQQHLVNQAQIFLINNYDHRKILEKILKDIR